MTMTPKLPASDGTEQPERMPAALAPGYFAVDELPLEARVAMSASLGASLRFLAEPEAAPRRRLLADETSGDEARLAVELDFELLVAESAGLAWPPDGAARAASSTGVHEAGNWGELFCTDEALLLARLIAIDLAAWQGAYLRGLESLPTERLAQQIVLMASALDNWYRSLRVIKQPAATALADRIQQYIAQQLATELQAVLRRANRPQALAGLDDSWRAVAAVRPAAALSSARSEREQLRGRFFSFLSAFSRLQQLARLHLPASLRSERHEPAVGLLLAFLQLYGQAQAHINRFSDELTDFYYLRCLGLQPQAAQADQVHLVCKRDALAVQDPRIPAGTGFGAGKDAAGRPIEFRAESELVLGDAQVASLFTLRLERDALISPEREFGYVTRAKVAQLTPAPLGADALGSLPHWPLFGGTGSAASIVSGASPAVDAPLGLAIASPLLWLKEGEREIRVNLYLATPEGSPASRLGALLQEAERGALTSEAFSTELGRYFAHWLLAEQDDLTPADLTRLRAAATQLVQISAQHREDSPMHAADPLCLLRGTDQPERDIIYDQVFDNLFTVSLSTEAGWWDAGEAYVVRPEPAEGRGRSGLQLVVHLRAQDPAVVGCTPELHGPGWGTALPLLRLQVTGRSSVYPYSLLESMLMEEVALQVDVRDARDLVLHNNLGRLDAAKSFNPFGPLPTTASYLVLGSPEMARKNVVAMRLHVEWAELPPADGGFRVHYEGYDPGYPAGENRSYGNDSFTATLSLLRDGRWQPATAGAAAHLHLFGSEPVTERVSPQRVIDVDPAALRTHFRPSSEPLQFDLHTRGGFFKLQLSGPPNAFGHQAYPQLLTHTVSANARHKYRKPLPLPNPPYTPMVERLRFDYRASSSIHLRSEVRAAPGEVGADVERVFHLHPFGMEEIHPAAGDRPHGVLPPCGPDGNLCIGLAAGQLQGALSLLFHLRAESALQQVAAVPPVRWYYLAANRWWPLAPSQVLSDTTAGFLTSGIVTLDVPAEIRSDNSVLPGGLFWLRASAGHGFEAFAGLYGVHAQAVRAVRVMAAGAPAAPVPMAAGTVKEVMVNVPGLSGVVQVGTSFGLRAHEEQALMRARAGERLQHKNRACTPWDIERLVLARFPSVFKVKCFAQPLDATQPGEVLVVVVPATRRNEPLESTLGPRVNAIELMRMAEHLQRAASPFARIRVRNASYERIQVRCNLQLVRGTHVGQALQRLNQRINEYLSPWHDEGYQARFDWTVRSEDIEACIRSAPGVEAVTQLSLLHIAADDSGVYTLGDTARPGSDGRNTVMPGHVQARMPWTLALPMPNHLLGVADATEPQDAPAPATGISKLAVGGTFIVGG